MNREFIKPFADKDDEIRVIFPSQRIFRDFLAFERESLKEFRRFFCRKQRIIYYCSENLNWGRRKIRQKTGISERQIRKFFQKVRDLE
jgi:predicted HTH transcriptional regulator